MRSCAIPCCCCSSLTRPFFFTLLSITTFPPIPLTPPHPPNHSAKAKARPNPLLLGLDPLRYFLRCLRSVKAPDLEQALLVLPFHYVSRFVPVLLQVGLRSLRGCCFHQSLSPQFLFSYIFFSTIFFLSTYFSRFTPSC